MLKLGWLNLKIGIMRDTCQFWAARAVTMKLWSTTKDKSPPEGR